MPEPGPTDFRSDTITHPTAAMRQAMAEAEVGDDVFGDDPTVVALEQAAAQRLGMEAGLFVPSGTMANQVALWTHSGRKGQVVCERFCHIAYYEGGAASLLSNLNVRTVQAPRGVFTPEQVHAEVLPDDPHFAPTKVVAIENTHNWAGGTIWQPDEVQAMADAAHEHGARLHVDGARVFNAAVATEASPADMVRGADSVMFCLSKGLSAPVGSVLCGSHEFIGHARYARKVLGGGMRQAGVLAAAGLVALDEMVDRLAEDHANAQRLADGLAGLPGMEVTAPETNIVYVDVAGTGMDAEAFCAAAAEAGVHCLPRDAGSVVRFVTHRHITEGGVDQALASLAELLPAAAM